MSEHGDAGWSDRMSEAEFFSPEEQLRDEVDTALHQREQLEELILLRSERRSELLTGYVALLVALVTIAGLFILHGTSDRAREFLPGIAVLVLFGAYQVVAAYVETGRDLLRLRRLAARLMAAATEGQDALREATARPPSFADHAR